MESLSATAVAQLVVVSVVAALGAGTLITTLVAEGRDRRLARAATMIAFTHVQGAMWIADDEHMAQMAAEFRTAALVARVPEKVAREYLAVTRAVMVEVNPLSRWSALDSRLWHLQTMAADLVVAHLWYPWWTPWVTGRRTLRTLREAVDKDFGGAVKARVEHFRRVW